jgi:hypothetical protein
MYGKLAKESLRGAVRFIPPPPPSSYKYLFLSVYQLGVYPNVSAVPQNVFCVIRAPSFIQSRRFELTNVTKWLASRVSCSLRLGRLLYKEQFLLCVHDIFKEGVHKYSKTKTKYPVHFFDSFW